MKKLTLAFMCVALLATAVVPAEANSRPRWRSGATRAAQSGQYDNSRQNNNDYYRNRNRSFWDKHRDKLSVAIGAGSGAAIGGLIGGKKGAGIGALGGSAGAALYTYKLRNRNNRYYRY